MRITNKKKSKPRSPEDQMLWSVYQHMHDRVDNPNNDRYADYGGRGIKICPSWYFFDSFKADMGPRPSYKHSIERKDNNGNYEPSNCKWATTVEQNNNRRPRISTKWSRRRHDVPYAN